MILKKTIKWNYVPKWKYINWKYVASDSMDLAPRPVFHSCVGSLLADLFTSHYFGLLLKRFPVCVMTSLLFMYKVKNL